MNSIISGGRRKLHYLYPDKTELVEELDVNTNECLLRKWKRPKEFGDGTWEFEIGEDPKQFDPENDLIGVAAGNPYFKRIDTRERFEWRIRNLPYPKETYIIEVDHDKQQIVLKTTNKKYYKRIDIPDLKRLGLKIDESSIAWKYMNNTVIISYDKPAEAKQREREILLLAHKAAAAQSGGYPQKAVQDAEMTGQQPECKQ